MSTIAATRPRADSLKTPFILAIILHGCILIFAVVGNYFQSRGTSWGGPGGSLSVGIVNSVPAIPLPEPDLQAPSRVVDNSKGLYESTPTPPVVAPDATEIPEFLKNKPPKVLPKPKPQEIPTAPTEPKYNSRPSRLLDKPTPPPTNAVPYGQGGSPAIPRSSAFAMGPMGTTQAGISLGGATGGDFGSMFPWYITAVERRISSNWLQSTIDPNLPYAPPVTVTFTISRNGAISNAHVTQSSGNYSVDASALRAVQQSNPLEGLPPGYSGSYLTGIFSFNYKR